MSDKTVIEITVNRNLRSKHLSPKAYIAVWRGSKCDYIAHGKSPKIALTNLIAKRYK
jgi:hypothetical protein